MATTMNLIAKQTVGSAGAASVTFSNIPQTFTDLKIVLSNRATPSAVVINCSISFNGSTSSFTQKMLSGDGSNTNSYSRSDNLNFTMANAATSTASIFSNEDIYIPNYRSANLKSFGVDTVTENNGTEAHAQIKSGLWSNTTAITSFTVAPQSGTFVEFTEVWLYGISSSSTQNTSVPLASGGDVITTDGSYWYHTFLYSGTFTPLKNLTCDYLVVAGGGAGGGGNGGGGGAGGLRSTVTATGGGGTLETALALTAQQYTATVGAGGAGSLSTKNNGTNSVFATITSTGGGAGGENFASGNGNTGGSGGGANGGTVGAGTANQGYAGGLSATGSTYNWGGGGGASQVGTSASSGVGGKGGDGVAVSISGSSVTYAGGGGGGADNRGSGTAVGAGGSGGGAAGVTGGAVANNATANTGGGGGGAGGYNGTDKVGGNGGSGIIIVRYAV